MSLTSSPSVCRALRGLVAESRLPMINTFFKTNLHHTDDLLKVNVMSS